MRYAASTLVQVQSRSRRSRSALLQALSRAHTGALEALLSHKHGPIGAAGRGTMQGRHNRLAPAATGNMATRLLHRALMRTTALISCHAAAASALPRPQAALVVPPLAARRHYARAPLGGKNIFQLRAAAEVAQAETQQPKGSSGGGKPSAAANPYEGVVLPTSDESDDVLRIRHSVSGALGRDWVQRAEQNALRRSRVAGRLAVPLAANRAACGVQVSSRRRLRAFAPPLPIGPSARTSWPWRCSACSRTRR